MRRRISNSDKNFLLWMHDFKCANCKSEEWLEVDHITPLSRGGEDHISNMQILCSKCNLRKRDSHDGIFVYDDLKMKEGFQEALLCYIFGEKDKANSLLPDVMNNNDEAVRIAITKAVNKEG